ncbi:MAG: tRNA pseudouridine(55) synthase TruB [Clostridia bacterium]|nr:tRNA pseudouridine(55) synthase TruB [Clostridia bacterium]
MDITLGGIVNINKPKGLTSHTVVSRVRRILGIKRVGHTGTLDPDAEGVLPVCVGKATKLSDYVMGKEKIYRAALHLGITTDTQDMSGEIISKTTPNISKEEFKQVVNSFVGEIKQIPPMYSAIKVGGKKLYELARQGVEVERKERSVTIYAIDIEEFDGEIATINVHCSKGTYIRTLCHDIGEKLGCGGAMGKLIRIKNGRFEISESVTLEEFEKNPEKYIVPADEILSEYPRFVLDEEQERKVLNGMTIPVSLDDGFYRLYSSSGKFLCLSEMVDKTYLKMRISFY